MHGELGFGLQISRALPRSHLLILDVAMFVVLDLIEVALGAALSLGPGQGRVHARAILVLVGARDRCAHHVLLVVRGYRALVEMVLGGRIDAHVVRAVVREVDVLHAVPVKVPL